MKRVFLFFLALCFCLPAFASTNAVAILVDTSRSIPPDDFEKARTLIRKILDSAAPEDQITIYAFGNDLRKVSLDELKNLQASESYTMLYDAAYDAARELEKQNAERKSIIIISDGIDTKSATILEDTAAYVNQHGISIYGIGAGKTQRKTLERLSRLTGGTFYTINTPDIAQQWKAAQAAQIPVAASAPAVTPTTVTVTPAPPPAAPHSAAPAESPAPPAAAPTSSLNLVWIGGIAVGLLFLAVAGWVVARAFRKEERTCSNCGRILESYQTVCPACPAITGQRSSPLHDSTQEIGGATEDPELIPVELLEKRPVTEEMLSKTFVLMATPVLVIRKGPSIGKSFSLNRVYPVSIGRSRVNEIKIEDVAVSGQHCKIIPENGRHVLYDLGSTNGTYVNEKRVNKLALNEGDIIKVGETQFLYKIEQQRN